MIKKLIDLFYLKFDNANVLKLLKDKDAAIDPRGNYSSEELVEYISQLKDGDEVSDSVFPSYLSTFISEYFSLPAEDGFLYEDRLAALYYAYAMESRNQFVSSWFGFNLTLNNILVALTARKFKLDIAPLIVVIRKCGEALRTSNARDFGLGTEVDYLEQLVKSVRRRNWWTGKRNWTSFAGTGWRRPHSSITLPWNVCLSSCYSWR